MADDLDDFLKQAAQRRKQRQQQKSERAPIESASPPVLSQPISREPIPTLAQQSNDAYEQVKPIPVAKLEPVAEPVRLAEEPSRLQSSFSQFESQPKAKKGGKKAAKQPSASLSSETANMASQTTSAQYTSALPFNSSEIAKQLRNPQTLKTAIIVHEILKRPWE